MHLHLRVYGAILGERIGQSHLSRWAPIQLAARTMGCTPPRQLSELWPLHWEGCNFIPEDLHPKSFRGYFGHNTNVWATADVSAVQVNSS